MQTGRQKKKKSPMWEFCLLLTFIQTIQELMILTHTAEVIFLTQCTHPSLVTSGKPLINIPRNSVCIGITHTIKLAIMADTTVLALHN